MTLGDAIAQTVIEKKKLSKFDFRRSLRFVFFGTFLAVSRYGGVIYKMWQHRILFHKFGQFIAYHHRAAQNYLQSNLSTKITVEKTKDWSLETGGLTSHVNLFFKSLSGTDKNGLYSQVIFFNWWLLAQIWLLIQSRYINFPWNKAPTCSVN